MLKIRTLDTVNLGSGAVVGLNEDQARPRKKVLQEKGPGVYVTTGIVQFKGGEVLEVEGEDVIPKAFAKKIEKIGGKVRDAEPEEVQDEKPETAPAKKVAKKKGWKKGFSK